MVLVAVCGRRRGVLRLSAAGIFGSHDNISAATGLLGRPHPFQPKHVTLERVWRSRGGGTINYLDVQRAARSESTM